MLGIISKLHSYTETEREREREMFTLLLTMSSWQLVPQFPYISIQVLLCNSHLTNNFFKSYFLLWGLIQNNSSSLRLAVDPIHAGQQSLVEPHSNLSGTCSHLTDIDKGLLSANTPLRGVCTSSHLILKQPCEAGFLASKSLILSENTKIWFRNLPKVT